MAGEPPKLVESTGITRFSYTFANTADIKDFRDAETVSALRKYNPSLLLQHYRKTGDKDRAVNLLLILRRPGITLRVSKEIVYTYIFFKDFTGALEYLRHYEITNQALKPLEGLVKMHKMASEGGCWRGLYSIARECIAADSACEMVKLIVQAGGEDAAAQQSALKELGSMLADDEVSQLGYGDAKFLYEMIPGEKRFLRRMVQTNPRISKEYYSEYLRCFGEEKEVIVGVIAGCYRRWAFRIALKNGWMEKSLIRQLGRVFCKGRLFINSQGVWSHSKDRKGIMFIRGKEAFQEDERKQESQGL